MKIHIALLMVSLMYFSCASFDGSSQMIDEAVPIENNSDRAWVEGWLSLDENRQVSGSNVIKIPYILSRGRRTLLVPE